MLDTIPTTEEMTALVVKSLYKAWKGLCALIDEHCDIVYTEKNYQRG